MGILSIEFKDDLPLVKELAKEIGYQFDPNDGKITIEELTAAMQSILLDQPFETAYKNIALRDSEVITKKETDQAALDILIDQKIEEAKPTK